MRDGKDLWQRFQHHYCRIAELGLSVDISRMNFSEDFFSEMQKPMEKAFADMDALEKGAIANPDEDRMVGHYWLRDSELAPNEEIGQEIEDVVSGIVSFAEDVQEGKIAPPTRPKFTQVLNIGIGGSALGPMFVADALGDPETDKLKPHFIDNTDPDGLSRILRGLGGNLAETLCVVTSKSGGTPETRNGMLTISEAYRYLGLDFERHAVAITMFGSKMYHLAEANDWLRRFPMFDWIGGRTSELSAVGLLPAALQGIDVEAMLEGARACDQATRIADISANPAALLALSWFHATGGKGKKDMVVLPYKDRLLLFSRYLQQLVMESLGKRLDLDGNVVEQGINVFGNKGSTDQHAYVQQLRDGINNFFVTFVRVLEDGGSTLQVEPNVTSGDYLHGFLLGTRSALFENGRESITITIPRVDAKTIGALIALFERAVGFYASLININAYHQPGVEAGKKAASAILELQLKILDALSEQPKTAMEVAQKLHCVEDVESIFLILEHLAANGRACISVPGNPSNMTFCKV